MGALWLDEISPQQRARVGGKAFTLALLKQAGLPVPDGFVLDAEALQGPEALLQGYARLGGSVAVRSSALAEDLAEASFAGQYLSLLDVRGASAVQEAAARCFASSGAVAGYAQALGASAGGGMAVLVQRFVEPRLAGVVFTRDPRRPERMLIEAHAGRGEELVSGRVRPERHEVDRAAPGTSAAMDGARLDAATRLELVRLAERVEALLGGPQDIEWAVGEAGLVLLQARPITVEAEEAEHPLARRLTRANVGEVLPDPVTPLTWSSVGAFLEHGFRGVARTAGLLPAGDDTPFLVLHRRRLYLNLTQCVAVASRLPGVSARDAERLVLGGGSGAIATPAVRLAALPGYARVALRLLGLARSLPGAIAAVEREVRELPGKHEVARAEPGALAELLERLLATGRRLSEAHIAASGSSAFRLALLTRFVESRGLDTPGDLVNRLVGGLEAVESASPTLALERLAAEARAQPAWRAALEADPAAAALDLREGRLPTELHARLEAFLARYGHRAVSEAELRAPAWEDDPAPVFAALRTLMASPRPAGFGHAARAAARHADEQALQARLGLLSGALGRHLLRGAQAWVAERERTKSLAVALCQHLRRVAHRAAGLLAGAGRLGEADDVFFLTAAELVAALHEGSPPAPATLLRRRRRQAREAALVAPRLVDLDHPPDGEARGERPLHGTGVSPGVGVGPARVLRDGSTPELRPGEVLVAPVLDAALGPLLASAAGAVAEIGGLLSHGAVVVRELGVPCVVDVADATSRIRDGQRVLVDGSSGRVCLLDEPSEAEALASLPAALFPAQPPGSEGWHALEEHPQARESVYFNVQDPHTGLALVASLGRRHGERGEALLALRVGEGPLLFGLALSRAELAGGTLSVAGFSASCAPVGLSAATRLQAHRAERFPPGPLGLLLGRAAVDVRLELQFEPSTPAVDLCDGLSALDSAALEPLGSHHVEQSGRYLGELLIDGRRLRVEGTGSRDQSWGRREWSVADHWSLFTLRLDDDLALHALSVSVHGRRVEGGFLWRAGRLERITRVEHDARRRDGGLERFELLVATALGPPLHLRGRVERRLSVPVELQRRPSRHLRGRPWALVLHEHFTRYEALGRVGYGMAELTERA